MRKVFGALAVCALLSGCQQSQETTPSDALDGREAVPAPIYTNVMTLLDDTGVPVNAITTTESSMGDCLVRAAFIAVSASSNITVQGDCFDQTAAEEDAKAVAKDMKPFLAAGSIVAINVDLEAYGISYECVPDRDLSAADRLRAVWNGEKTQPIKNLKFDPEDVQKICKSEGKPVGEIKSNLRFLPLGKEFNAAISPLLVTPRVGLS